MSDASYTQVTGKLDLINRQDAIDDLHGKDPSRIWDTADIEVWLNDLPSAEPEIAENLYLYKCYITDKDGLQHEVIYTDDIRRVTGWEI